MSDKLTKSDIEDIMALIDGSSFDHLSLEMGDLKLSLQRSGAGPVVAAPVPTAPVAPTPSSAVPQTGKPVSQAIPEDGLTDVASNMLGTFYHAPKPGADPFVSVGSKVSPDSVIGIVEVMKLMTSVEAGIGGTVAEIVAPDGELVEHGQVLIRVRQD